MAHILDVRSAGGELVVLGDGIVVPTSFAAARASGMLRRNSNTGNLEFAFQNPNVTAPPVWQSVSVGVSPDQFVSSSGGTISGSLTVTGSAIIGSNLRVNGFIDGDILAAAYAADIAERYEADKPYEPGTVLVIGGEKEVTTTNIYCDTRLAGIVATNPAFKMNTEAGTDATHPYIALKGRVPCKIVGLCRKGDLLTTSEVAGHAMKAPTNCHSAAIIGKALHDFDGYLGLVEVMI